MMRFEHNVFHTANSTTYSSHVPGHRIMSGVHMTPLQGKNWQLLFGSRTTKDPSNIIQRNGVRSVS
jgi:hypothetical protein